MEVPTKPEPPATATSGRVLSEVEGWLKNEKLAHGAKNASFGELLLPL